MAEERLHHFDYLRILATFCVLVLHVTSGATGADFYTRIPRGEWLFGESINAFTRFAVPVFFMLSGAMLLDERRSFRAAKSIIRVGIPLIAWSIVYIIWTQRGAGPLSMLAALPGIIRGPVMFHLWFVYAIIGLYLLIPVLRKLTVRGNERMVGYAVLLWVIFMVLLPFVRKTTGFGIGVDIGFFSSAVGYALLGWLLNSVAVRAYARFAVPAFIIGWVWAALGTWRLTALAGGRLDEYHHFNNAPGVLLMSAAVFVLFRVGGEQGRFRESSVISTLSKLSFAFYLAHILMIELTRRLFHVHPLWKSAYIGVPATAALAGAVTLAVVWLLWRTRVTRRVFHGA